jgi:outer membrane immunogenic protein
MRNRGLVTCATIFALCIGIETGQAQTWTGGYIGGTLGGRIQPEGNNRIVVFDKTLDGDFSDTITTAAGANAFSAGFCFGAAVNAMPASGCRKDDRGSDFGVRSGYDCQIGRWIVGGVIDVTKSEQASSVSAFSTTPAFYTPTRNLDWLDGFRARSGFVTGRYLLYGTAGLARLKRMSENGD